MRYVFTVIYPTSLPTYHLNGFVRWIEAMPADTSISTMSRWADSLQTRLIKVIICMKTNEHGVSILSDARAEKRHYLYAADADFLICPGKHKRDRKNLSRDENRLSGDENRLSGDETEKRKNELHLWRDRIEKTEK
jgi:hypothetical protein